MTAEYSTVAPPQNPTTSYLTTDHLGSPRVITDENGEVIARRDFMPFGEELYAGVGPRTQSLKYSYLGSDNVRQRFTGYEKDDETGLDFAEARMYQNKHGRFTAPDPLLASASAVNPQTFNRYIYTGNNPVNYTDPSGLVWCHQNGSGSRNAYWTEGSTCKSGYSVADGNDVVITRGDLTPWSTNGPAGAGTVVTLNSNGTVTVLDPSNPGEAARIAIVTGSEVQATQEETVSSSATEISSNISPRQPDLLPLPCPGGIGACGTEGGWSSPLSQPASADEMLDAIEIGAAGLGQLPGIGEPIDLFVGGGVSLLRGDREGFVLSVVAAVPGPVGNAAGLTKIARKARKGVNAADSVGGAAKGSKQAINNAERMKQGKPPIGNDGHPMELHHKGQDPNGKLVPMTRTEHRGKGNYKKNHPDRGPSKIDRKEAAKARRKFWRRMGK